MKFIPVLKLVSAFIISTFFWSCASQKNTPQTYAQSIKQANSTRMKAITKGQDKDKNKRAENSAKGRQTKFDATPYNPFTDQRRDDNRRKSANLDKPQYSNPLYFGHKKKPKKRKRGKQKVCKECGIKH